MTAYPILDVDGFTDAALACLEATHFAAAGNSNVYRWFHPAARTREMPFIDDSNFFDDGRRRVVACRLDSIAREAVRRYLRKAWRIDRGGSLWHWTLHTDELELIGVHDWGGEPAWVHSDLKQWAEALQRQGVLGKAVDRS